MSDPVADALSMTHFAPQPDPAQQHAQAIMQFLQSGIGLNPVHLPGTQPKDYLREMARNPDIMAKNIEQASNFNFGGVTKAPKGNWLDTVRGALREPAAKPPAAGNLASRIEDTYNKLKSEKRYHFIDIADVKDAMPDVPLADLHAELKNNPRFGTYPNDNRAALTQRDHDAALTIGAGRPQHKMFLVEPEK